MEKLNITFCSFPDFGGNAKALYEYMNKRYKDNMNYIWIVYIGIIVMSWYSNTLERKYFIYNDHHCKERYQRIMIFIL